VSVTEPEQPADGEEIEEFKGRATTGAACWPATWIE